MTAVSAKPVVAVVGLGYVGLPLAVAFGHVLPTIGYDRNATKIRLYQSHRDPTGEVTSDEFARAVHISFTDDPMALALADMIIVAVPTPIDRAHNPDLRMLLDASRTVGNHMKRGATVIYESTVYPGCTEEDCVPVLEAASGMRWKKDFHVAYSPERINPGDREHRLETIVKVVAGDSPETLERVADLYGRVVRAGIYRAPSIMVAEAAKVIENTQRDLNIALVNELALIFHRLGIDTVSVLEAAETKWNFLPFRPGLVGGHCIGVDPYYLTYKAETFGYHPQVVLAGRRINDGMGKFVAEQTVKRLIANGSRVKGAKVAVLGLTFKENCPDLRNSRVADIVAELASYNTELYVHDPVADPEEAEREYGIRLTAWEALPRVEAMVVAVAHRHYRALDPAEICAKLQNPACIMDVKAIFDPRVFEGNGISLWRL